MLAAVGGEANFEGVRKDSLAAAVSMVAAWTLASPLPAAAQVAADQAKLPGVRSAWPTMPAQCLVLP